MWPFDKKPSRDTTIKASSVLVQDGVATIDVIGQTCPGYLLSINKALDSLEAGVLARLLTTYSPCGDDLEAYCRARGLEYLGASEAAGVWVIEIRKPLKAL